MAHGIPGEPGVPTERELAEEAWARHQDEDGRRHREILRRAKHFDALVEALDIAQRGCGSALNILLNVNCADRKLWLEMAAVAEEDVKRGYDQAQTTLDAARLSGTSESEGQ